MDEAFLVGRKNKLTSSVIADESTGIIYAYDDVRNRYLSVNREQLPFACVFADSRYLSIGQVTGSATGYLLNNNAVITAISIIQSGGNPTKSFEIRKNNEPSSLDIVSLVDSQYKNFNKNIDLNAGDYLQVFATSIGDKAQNVVAMVEIAYRKD
jgi:hypothetical protein